jgi:rfaE bifunctional protein nucleotidyltransferase chain/domain
VDEYAACEICPRQAPSLNGCFGDEMARTLNSDFMQDKLIIAPDAHARLGRLARPLVFTNGVFDVLHRGHVTYLTAAREMGASLLVAVNTDESARRLQKGIDRPLNPDHDRAWLVAALACVDAVMLFDEDTPCALLQRVRPDLYVKGGDYDIEALEETRLVRSWGGNAQSLPFIQGYSTSSLIDRIRAGA